MPTGVGVRGGVTMRGVVAAADVATLEADAQMKPRLARDEAVLTAVHSIRQ
jgi:hypothetical protein